MRKTFFKNPSETLLLNVDVTLNQIMLIRVQRM